MLSSGEEKPSVGESDRKPKRSFSETGAPANPADHEKKPSCDYPESGEEDVNIPAGKTGKVNRENKFSVESSSSEEELDVPPV